jgi:hypothetical protein
LCGCRRGKVYLELPSSLDTQGSGVGKDFNNDGQADLIWENVDDGRRLIWIMHNGSGPVKRLSSPQLTRAGTLPRSVISQATVRRI